jgi:hypothetical protein
MPRDVDSVKTLTPEENAAVHASFIASHRPAKGGNQLKVFAKALTNPVVLALCFVKFTRDVAFYGITYCEHRAPCACGRGSRVRVAGAPARRRARQRAQARLAPRVPT